ncbi:MAG: hypothetical protein QNL68_11970, partial [Akkermansiaceae bacterium]
AAVDEPDYPIPTRELMQDAEGYAPSSRFKNPWKHYVEPVFGAVRHLSEIRPELVYRVYLANDLSFLIPDLVEAGCEVSHRLRGHRDSGRLPHRRRRTHGSREAPSHQTPL